MNKEQLVCNLVSMIYGNKIVGFDKRDEFLDFLKMVIDLVNRLDDNIEDITRKETIKQIAKMIASGEVLKETYDKYLSKCPIGFMSEEDLINYLLGDNND